MICCWIEKPNCEEFKKHLPRIHDFLWLAEDGMKSKVILFVICNIEERRLFIFLIDKVA